MCGGEIEVSKYMLVGAVRAGARPVFNVELKDIAKWKRIKNGDFGVGSQCVIMILLILMIQR